MNCQEFQNIFNTHAVHASMPDVDTHMQACAACREYAREQNLTAGLRQVAASTAACQASPAVESVLRQAFRQHVAQAATPRALIASHNHNDAEHVTTRVFDEHAAMYATSDIESEPDTHEQSHKIVGINHLIAAQTANLWRVRPGGVACIVAVFCLVTVGVIATRWQSSGTNINQEATHDTASPRQQNALSSSAPSRASSLEAIALQSPVLTDDETPKAFAPVIMQPASFTPARRTAHRPRRKLKDNTVRDTERTAPENQIENQRIATQFFSLDDSLPPVESGHLVSVELPRSALASFGLPTSIERANEVVKAEVLVGTDGIARAIRFVR